MLKWYHIASHIAWHVQAATLIGGCQTGWPKHHAKSNWQKVKERKPSLPCSGLKRRGKFGLKSWWNYDDESRFMTFLSFQKGENMLCGWFRFLLRFRKANLQHRKCFVKSRHWMGSPRDGFLSVVTFGRFRIFLSVYFVRFSPTL